MQIMPENNLARAAAGTSASASPYADQAGDLFGLEISRLLQDDTQGSLPAETAEMEEEDEDERTESAASSPYNPVLRPVSPFEPQEVRLTPGEADSIVEAMREDGVPANVLNAVKDAGRTAGGATLDMLMNAVRKALNGERPTGRSFPPCPASWRERRAVNSRSFLPPPPNQAPPPMRGMRLPPC